MNDLVRRLNDIAELMEDIGRGDWCDAPTVREAAAEIERLEAALASQKKAIVPEEFPLWDQLDQEARLDLVFDRR